MIAALALLPIWAQATPAPLSEELREGLAVRGVSRSGRIPFPTDWIQASLAEGAWRAPVAGQAVPGASATWTPIVANERGEFDQRAFQGGYAWFRVVRDQAEVAILEASGHGMAFVNGEPRAGDPYGFGYLKLPVHLRQGDNELLFSSGRGAFRARLSKPKAEAVIFAEDPTLPDLREGSRAAQQWAGVTIANATAQTMSGLILKASVGSVGVENRVPDLPPLSILKIAFRFPGEGIVKPRGDSCNLRLELKHETGGGAKALDSAELSLRVRKKEQTYKRTFFSRIDGSVQYYAVHPASGLKPGEKAALVLSLHGAGVEAIGQADAYGAKTWCHIVCPTNRRPYGFDWEDWGRLDALEALEQACSELNVDRARVTLTGHSMGGHGAWNLSVLRPDLFAAVGPSAGWRSFFTYAGGRRSSNPSPIEAIFERARLSSDTEAFVRNLAELGVYVLHGDADDNVPVSEARAMREKLQPWHPAFSYFEKHGAGHWWDDSDAPGAACVDWPPMFELFRSRRLPLETRASRSQFCTPSPVVLSQVGFARILSQQTPMALSAVDLALDPETGRLFGTTENVARLAVSLPQSLSKGSRLRLELDGDALTWESDGSQTVILERAASGWDVAKRSPRHASMSLTEPTITGQFKGAFDRQALLVYGTAGDAQEDAWALAKARYDSETFAYRGNGSFKVVSDEDLLKAMSRARNAWEPRNLVLYGNEDTNRAWRFVLPDPEIRLRRGYTGIGRERGFLRDDLGVLCLMRSPVTRCLIGIVGGTGIRGMRLTDKLPYFISGVQYPDWCVFGPEVLTQGIDAVLGAGFFDERGRVSPKDAAWHVRSWGLTPPFGSHPAPARFPPASWLPGSRPPPSPLGRSVSLTAG